jgi:NAD(P)-dependent dehydrogenase (short-subunit alcohol dehydrogenase family)
MGRLDNRVAIVTGAARGLGAGIAQALGREGATVVCADTVDATATAATLPGPHGTAINLDVTRSGDVEAAFEHIAETYRRFDILVNNAGIAQPIVPFVETTDETVVRVLDVNVRGVIHCARAAAKIMIGADRGGRIINIASHAGKCAGTHWGIYSASKAAVIALTQAMALELAPNGITANAVCPGTMDTDMTRSVLAEAAGPAVRVDDLVREYVHTIPMGRLGTPDDVGRMCAWLASDESAFTTGAALNVTGGESVFF